MKKLLGLMLLLSACTKPESKVKPCVMGIEGNFRKVAFENWNYQGMDKVEFTSFGADSVQMVFPEHHSRNGVTHDWYSVKMCNGGAFRTLEPSLINHEIRVAYRGDTLVDSLFDSGYWLGNNLYLKY